MANVKAALVPIINADPALAAFRAAPDRLDAATRKALVASVSAAVIKGGGQER